MKIAPSRKLINIKCCIDVDVLTDRLGSQVTLESLVASRKGKKRLLDGGVIYLHSDTVDIRIVDEPYTKQQN